jgi:hypothetical protein
MQILKAVATGVVAVVVLWPYSACNLQEEGKHNMVGTAKCILQAAVCDTVHRTVQYEYGTY